MLTSPDSTSSLLAAAERGRLRLLKHGAIIAVIGLLSGFGLVIAILEAIHIWPVTIPSDGAIPGSEHGLMMMIIGVAMVHALPKLRAQAWIVWGMVYTGYGNTVFFHLANISNNRGLSAGTTRFGEADWAGVMGYVIGASTIPFTIIAVALLGLAAARRLRA